MSRSLTKCVAALACLALAMGLAALATTSAQGQNPSLAKILGGDPCDSPAPTPAYPEASTVKIASFNIRAGTTTQDFSQGVHGLLPKADIIGLQETNTKDKAMVLANLASQGWDFYRQYRTDISAHPHQGGTEQQPVLWRSDRFTCTYAGPALLSGIYLLHGEKPAFDDDRTHYFTLVHLVDNVTGQRIAIINIHLIPGVISSGLPVRGIPRHWDLYQKQLTNVIAEAQREQGWGTVYVLGDFNSGYLQDVAHDHKGLPYRSFRAIGYKSMWATETPASGRGSRQHALIDQVYTARKAKKAHVVFSLRGYSDHKPVVAQYSLPAAS
jgi:endonuclease/exonuclease/phosphatase family metal-dependent hydrolase